MCPQTSENPLPTEPEPNPYYAAIDESTKAYCHSVASDVFRDLCDSGSVTLESNQCDAVRDGLNWGPTIGFQVMVPP